MATRWSVLRATRVVCALLVFLTAGTRALQDDGTLVGVPFVEAAERLDALDEAAGWRVPTWIVDHPNAWFVDGHSLRRHGESDGGPSDLALRTASTFRDVEVRSFWSPDGRDARLALIRIEGRTVTLVEGSTLVFSGEPTSPHFTEARSRPAFAHWSLPSPTNGHRLGLLASGDPMWLHGVAWRSLDAEPELLSALPVDGGDWRALGDAVYTIDGDVLAGRVGGGAQSFLVTEALHADFLLDVDVHLDDMGNSGIQVRSHVNDSGRLYGTQVEIDPKPRAWSGGIYDEGRRGWLQSLAANDAGRAAFKLDDWNRFRIECVGPRFRVWVNDVPTADLLDPLNLVGHIAFQVHSGDNTALRWRNPRVRDLGSHVWRTTTRADWTAGEGVQLEDGAMGGLVLSTPEDVSPWRERMLTSVALAHDVGLHLRVRAPDGLRVVTQAPDQGAGSVIARVTEGVSPVWSHDAGHWVADLGAALADGEVHDVHVICAGDRRVVHVDGRVVHALHGVATLSAAWAIGIECPEDSSVELVDARRLERVR